MSIEETPFLFFMVAQPHSLLETLINDLEKYLEACPQYIISSETSKDSHLDISGQHFHIATRMTEKQYDSFRKTILVKKYSLRGQAKNGLPRQYGKVLKVRDETKFLQYTLKDKNYISKNINLKQIQEWIDASYPRQDKFDFMKELTIHLQQNRYRYIKSFSETQDTSIQLHILEEMVLEFHINHPYNIKQNKTLCLSRLRYYVNNYLQFNEKQYLNILLNYLKNSF